MGRPASDEPREKILHIRCSDAEHAHIAKRCPAGVPLSTWARQELLGKRGKA